MKSTELVPLALLFFCPVATAQQVKSFQEQQSQYPHVRTAAKEKDDALHQMFAEKKISYPRA